MYINQNKGYLPWTGNSDGTANNKPIGPWDDTAYWANAVPKLVGAHSYWELLQMGVLPGQAQNNLFVCPSAGPAASLVPGTDPNSSTSKDVVNSDGTFTQYGNDAGTTPVYASGNATASVVGKHVYWCYLINSKLDNTLPSGTYFIRVSNMTPNAEVPLLVEKGMNPSEVHPTQANTSLARGKTTWTRFTTRHNGGGHLLFIDGHVAWFSANELVPPGGTAPTSNPAYNLVGKATWDPFQGSNGVAGVTKY